MVVTSVVLKRILGLLTVVFALWGAGSLEMRFRRAPAAGVPTTPMFVAPTANATQTAAPTPGVAMTFVASTAKPPTTEPENLAPYPVYGPAVEIHDEVWLNSDAPVHLEDLRGRVVLLVFWAFECAPCMPALAQVNDWNDKYGDQGLTVIGIHYPKVDAEKSYDGLVEAISRLKIEYPVAQDNDGRTWRAYGQYVWPTLTLIDKRGDLRYQQIGAGGYEDTEQAIKALLEEQ